MATLTVPSNVGATARFNRASSGSLEVSIVMPCLNEADTVGTCVGKAMKALADAKINGEVIVADNGSTDGSREIAASLGARVVPVSRKGYGSALMGGIAAARGTYVIMGDADDSYDFGEIPRFVAKLREGHDVVQGCRLPTGGGTIAEGAMPWSHRWIGNPMFSTLTRWWFHAPIHDVYCGLRGFNKTWWERLDQRCTGMEFATEMILKGARFGADFAEVPITLHKDGRIAHAPHLKTFRDGWRTLRFFLMYAPRWLFLEPGKLLMLLGLVGYALALPRVTLGGIEFSLNTLIVASLLILCGYQAVLFAIGVKAFAMREGFVPDDARLYRFFNRWTLERGLIFGVLGVLTGVGLIGVATIEWAREGFGNLNYDHTCRFVIPGATLAALSCQTILSSFFVSILGMLRK